MGMGRCIIEGVSRVLPCVAYRAIIGGGSDARRGCIGFGVGASEVDGAGVTLGAGEPLGIDGVAWGEAILREGRD